MRRNKVLYTCMFGASEIFSNFRCDDDDVDYVCFTDDPTLKSDRWQIRLYQEPGTDSHRLSKRFKHLPHAFLKEYDASIYIDNTVMLRDSPSAMFQRFAGETMVMLRHPWRDCIYDEAMEVLAAGYDAEEIVLPQMEFYRSLNYPRHRGLNATTFIYRRHDVGALQKVLLEWHVQILRGSKRDQLSWNFCAWFRNLSFCSIDEDLMDNSLFLWPVTKGNVRLPRSFEDRTYENALMSPGMTSLDLRKLYLESNMKRDGRYYRTAVDGSQTIVDDDARPGFYISLDRDTAA